MTLRRLDSVSVRNLARRQGAWAILGHGGLILKRGHDLDGLLRYFDKGRFTVVN